MKVVTIDGVWVIMHKGVEVGTIEGSWRYGKPDKKEVWVGGTCLGEVANQKEAMQKVKEELERREGI